jgi:Integrase core domain
MHGVHSRTHYNALLIGDSRTRPMDAELLNRRRWKTRIELANALFEYLEIFHNGRRRHSALGMLTPIKYEMLHQNRPVSNNPTTRTRQPRRDRSSGERPRPVAKSGRFCCPRSTRMTYRPSVGGCSANGVSACSVSTIQRPAGGH